MNTNNNNPALPAGYTKRSVDTDSMSFFGNDMMLQIRFLDRTFLSLTFRPLQYDESGQRRFPKKEGEDSKYYNVSIRKEDAALLADRIEKYFIPTFSEYVDRRIEDPSFNKTITTGIVLEGKQLRIVDITSGIPGPNGYEPALRLISDIDSNRIGKHITEFKFDFGHIIDDYNPGTGEYKLSAPVYPQLILFKKVIDAFIFAASAATSHDVTMRFQQRLKDLSDTLDQVAIKNGVTPKHSTFGYTEKKEATSPFTPAAAPATEMKEVSLEALIDSSPY